MFITPRCFEGVIFGVAGQIFFVPVPKGLIWKENPDIDFIDMDADEFRSDEIKRRADELLRAMKKRARGIVAGKDGRFDASSLAISAWPVVQFKEGGYEDLDHLMRFAYVVMSRKMMNRIRKENKYGAMEVSDLLASEPEVMRERAIEVAAEENLRQEAKQSLEEFRERLAKAFPDKPNLIPLFDLLGKGFTRAEVADKLGVSSDWVVYNEGIIRAADGEFWDEWEDRQ